MSVDASYGFDDRLKRADELLALASVNGAKLALFPELFYGGYDLSPDELCKYDFEDGVAFFSALAIKYKIAVGFGVGQKTATKYKNSYIVLSNDGKPLAHYDKIHVFSFAKEDDVFVGGDKLASFELDGVTFGLSICYDLRFPEIFSLYSKECDAVLCPAAWPKKRVSNFKFLLKARALENLFTVVGINWQGKSDKGIEYAKSSAVATPKAAFKKPIFAGDEIDIYEINKREIPNGAPDTVKDKLFSLYASLYGQKAKKC